MIFESKSINETYEIAIKLIKYIKPGSVIALIGNLGSGKTAFSQEFAKGLGFKDNVGSPTFKLVSEYYGKLYNMYHIDVYRLKGSADFLNIGGEEYLLTNNSYTLIEWANIIEDILPEKTIQINFSRIKTNPNYRTIKVQGLQSEL